MPQQGLRVKLGEAVHLREPRRDDPGSESNIRPLRTLVLEDFPPLLDLYKRHLKAVEGIELVDVKPVHSMDDALVAFNTAKPDIVVTDLSLTASNTEGFNILRVLRRCYPRLCIILTTSVYSPESTDELSEHIRKASFDAAFNKFDLESLILFLKKKAIEASFSGP